MDDAAVKHLEFIQTAINRMASNAFMLKSWSVGITSAVFAASFKETSPHFVLVALFPAASFWYLDAFYLRHERLFRCLYNEVLADTEARHPFNMATTAYMKKESLGRALRSSSVWLIHGSAMALIIVVWRILVCDL